MKPHNASLLNAAVLLCASAWAWFGSATPSMTALIPTVFALLLLACVPGVKRESKVVAHLAAVLTLLMFVALLMPLRGALGREDLVAVMRVSMMLAFTAFALAMYVKSFIDIRKRRQVA